MNRFKLRSNSKGYTIVELLTVSFILIIISGVVSGIIISTLRGTARSRMVNEVSQNGNYALSVISSIVNTSTDVVGVDEGEVGGDDFTSDCTETPAPRGESIDLLRVDGNVTRLTCGTNISSASAETGISTNTKLLDEESVIVESGTCYFVCRQSSEYAPKIVEVGFTLIPPTVAPGTDTVRIPFSTQILLRSYRNQ